LKSIGRGELRREVDLDLTIKRGNPDKPAIVFIHGLGMDKNIWINPSKSRVLGGRLPLITLLSKRPAVKDFGLSKEMPKKTSTFSTGGQLEVIETLFNDLQRKNYSVLTWSQNRPAGPVDSAVCELEEVIKSANKITNSGIILIGHSRGGIIARKYLMKRDSSIRALVTISSPHKGSSIAKVACYLKPIASLIEPFFKNVDKGKLSSSIKHILNFLKSKALKELLPNSPLISSLKDEPLKWVYYISVGGTDPTLFCLYRWQWERLKEGESWRWILRPQELFSVPEIFHKVIPDRIFPDEIRKGMGDGLVSAKSSKIPWSNEHYDFPLNHAKILFDKDVRDLLVKVIERIS
jgi:pimeloyl-ACP methyl ester carboxylesterase